MIKQTGSPALKVKLVAIAKDEAAYLPEWIWHHLQCGVDSIDVYINRTTDNSADVLEKIQAQYPQVSFHYADWIDQCGAQAAQRMQFIVYAKAFYEARIAGEFTHIVFLDIDEYWFHQQSNATIKTFIASVSTDSVIYLEWLIDLPQEQAFSTLPKSIEGNVSVLGKCIFPLDAEIHTFRLHVPLYHKKTSMLLANGAPFIADDKKAQALKKRHSSLKRSFIYHRANRSIFEYVSLTRRGRPSSQFAYKENRTGISAKTQEFEQYLMPDDLYNERQRAFAFFIQQCELEGAMMEAQTFIKERYQHAINGLKDAVDEDYELMRRIFARVEDKAVVEAFTEYRKSLSAAQPKDADLHRNLAREASYQDLDEAIMHIEKAFELRPQGPKIREMREALKAQRNKRLATVAKSEMSK